MSLDEKKADDAIVRRDGVPSPFTESADLKDGRPFSGWSDGHHIVNPNAARTCGCGTSFEPARPDFLSRNFLGAGAPLDGLNGCFIFGKLSGRAAAEIQPLWLDESQFSS